MLPNDPGHSATVLVALAEVGGSPSPTSAGNVSRVPPPAMELTAPAAMAAANTSRSPSADTRVRVYRSGSGGSILFNAAGESRRSPECRVLVRSAVARHDCIHDHGGLRPLRHDDTTTRRHDDTATFERQPGLADG